MTYSLSKAALDQFTKSLALDLGPKNPALVVTNIIYQTASKDKVEELIEKTSAVYPLQKVGKPEEVAKAIAFLAGSESSFTTGVLLQLDGGAHLSAKIIAL
ncbi:hypothetical protein EB796_024164 [Bugula neritina]|uniref:Uncharacterized protein n=1 Tax=Bugula neritina TaxID=10212 RepID=A0A7J7IVA9_BUGNE|nr:hypothetical protein EB796_024164 [Bugula neritina]